MKGALVREDMNNIVEAPGKTWFWELAQEVIDADRCVRCGTCVAVCPSDSLGVGQESGLPELVRMCTGCSLCWDFCPRGGLRYEALWPRGEKNAGFEVIRGGERRVGGLGKVVAKFAARSSGSIERVQDGGVISALLSGALAAGEIDGALVTLPSDDPDEPWKGVARIATTPDEVASAAGSYYNQTMALASLDLRGARLPPRPRLALVGTPCEIEGLRALEARRWPTGSHRIETVVLTIAVLCTKSFDYEALMLRKLRDERGVDLGRVGKVNVLHGRMVVEYRDGAIAVDEPVTAFHGAALKGCNECADFLGRCADISVGSVGSLREWSSVIVRTEAGRAALERARKRLDLRDLDDPDALVRLDELDKRKAERSQKRALDPDGPLFIDFEDHLASRGSGAC